MDPQRYGVWNQNERCARVVYGAEGKPIQIPPKQWRWDVWLAPVNVEQLSQCRDLVLYNQS
jgi:hypothetical protein